MKKTLFLLLVTVLLLSCATFTPSITPTPTLVPIVETRSTLPNPTDPTQVLTAKQGQTFDIVLPANSSTGYRWQITSNLDTNLVQPAGQNYIAGQPVMPGSGGVEVWTFNAIAPGETTIEFGYFPPGNTTQPDETVIFSISVE